MNQELIDLLLLDLKNTDASIRDRATAQLWRIWFWQKGQAGLAQIEASEELAAQGQIDLAIEQLTQLTITLPDFTEAWNRRAVMYYIDQKYQLAIADCQQAIELSPAHFGAWHGLGLCHAALGNYASAITALRQALQIQPYSIENQRLLLECTVRLSSDLPDNWSTIDLFRYFLLYSSPPLQNARKQPQLYRYNLPPPALPLAKYSPTINNTCWPNWDRFFE